jgi:hypothetical protein
MDMTSILMAMAQANRFIYMDPPSPQVVRLDECALLDQSGLPARAEAKPGTILLQDFALPLTGCAMFGGKGLSVTPETSEDGSATATFEYTTPPTTITAVLLSPRPGELKGLTGFQFRVRSGGQTALLVSLEERYGPKETDKVDYQAVVEVGPAEPWKTVTLPLSAFAVDAAQPDPNGKLDVDKVEMIVLADLGATGETKEIKNRLGLASFVGLK